MLWHILTQFVFRLCFGLAMAMALTSAKQVASGFYRVHLWVILGFSTFAALIVASQPEGFSQANWLLTWAIAVAILSWVGSIAWLYEAVRIGLATLVLVAAISFVAACTAAVDIGAVDQVLGPWRFLDVLTSGLLLGTTFASMLLGHWYLNSPTMKLAPLKRLILLMAVAVAARAGVCAAGLAFAQPESYGGFVGAMLALRWLAGLAGTLGLAVMSWFTLKIPNTQSATGILYVAVVFVFLGELASQLLSAGGKYPL